MTSSNLNVLNIILAIIAIALVIYLKNVFIAIIVAIVIIGVCLVFDYTTYTEIQYRDSVEIEETSKTNSKECECP